MTLRRVRPDSGNAGIAGVFKACLDILSDVCGSKELEETWPLLRAQLDVERTLLVQWADKAKLLTRHYDERLDDLFVQTQIFQLLHNNLTLFMDKAELDSRFDIMVHEQEESLPDADYLQSYFILSHKRMENFNTKFTNLEFRVLHLPTKVLSTTRLLRVVRSVGGFADFLDHVRTIVNALNKVTYTHSYLDIVREMAAEDVKDCKTIGDLRMVRDVTKDDRIVIGEAAEALIVKVARKRVMHHLWFEGMDERRSILPRPHPGTYQWSHAPQQPDVGWDSLSDWLESGSGIYWVGGQAGAGKSTFLNHVLNHPETKKRLAVWGGEEKVSLGSFFFWKMGHVLQHTREGASWAILHHILEEIPDAIPKLVPALWHESYHGGTFEAHEGLPRPSIQEVNDAFEKMAEEGVLDRRFCFIIDALDEYGADAKRAVAFVRKLSKSPKIKLIVSSRLEPVFRDAFADVPKLHLDQLTDQDVLQYVQDKADSHRYMRRLREVDETLALVLVEMLAQNAEGVFLRAVLGTKLLLQGFDDFEPFYILEHRIQEIPDDLDKLVAHVISQMDPNYREQAAKILRICYRAKQARREQGERGRVWTMSLADADEKGMAFEDFGVHSERSLEVRHGQCVALEKSIAERCGGLLEVIRSDGDESTECFCKTPKSHPLHNVFLNSSVEFVHRSVFEWLGGLKSWELANLGVEEKSFNEDKALASMSWQQCRMGVRLGAKFERVDYDLADCLHYVGRTEGFSPEFAASMLMRIHDLVAETRRYLGKDWLFSFCCKANGELTERLETLYFAVGMGMINFVKWYLDRDPEGETMAELETKHSMKWWLVAADRQLMSCFLAPYYETIKRLPRVRPMLVYLAESGLEVPPERLEFFEKVMAPGDKADAMLAGKIF